MGKLRGLIKGDISRVFGSSTFILAVIATSLIMLTGSIGVYSDNTRYNVFQLVEDNSREEIRELGCQAIDAVYRGSSSYLWMFAPVLAGMPLIPLLCAERKNRAMRYELVRVTKKKFAIGKMISALISGGFVISFGYLIYAIVVYVLIPDKGSAVELADMQILCESGPKGLWDAIKVLGYPGIIVLKMIMMFLFGAISSIPAYLLSSFITNKYIVLCIPFIINYMSSMAIMRLMSTPLFYEHSNVFTKAVSSLMPEMATSICQQETDRMLIFAGVWTVIIVLSVIFYIVIEEKRCDCGQ